jgi:hypothetical protein
MWKETWYTSNYKHNNCHDSPCSIWRKTWVSLVPGRAETYPFLSQEHIAAIKSNTTSKTSLVTYFRTINSFCLRTSMSIIFYLFLLGPQLKSINFRWTKSRNPVILIVIYHHHIPTENSMNALQISKPTVGSEMFYINNFWMLQIVCWLLSVTPLINLIFM